MLRRSISDGLLRLAKLQEITEAVAEEMTEQRQRFDALRDKGPAPVFSSFNLFQTPQAVAEMMVSRLPRNIAGARILEPSAGLGRLYFAAGGDDSGADWCLVEHDSGLAGYLYENTRGRLVCADFLQCDAAKLGGCFDFVLMNPPFKLGADIRHITKAFELLKDGGRLVALCFNGVRQNRQLRPRVTTWDPLPKNSFASEGTRADVALVTWKK